MPTFIVTCPSCSKMRKLGVWKEPDNENNIALIAFKKYWAPIYVICPSCNELINLSKEVQTANQR